ncbi:helix-turn-helix domain-containing protein [Hymenobacter metallicola]|uniref:XRE family transcriptional regulator n=1 Tax=Hymenobacter metallicola TaxID=2563114 RepID=A0A4Z0QIW5_9BACT|nr:helix-turn-helix domain-containing protein [Hymenobacter metallicola]TGE29704.1 XRE family transcriptional regulator [Hymenobacter metallicola]
MFSLIINDTAEMEAISSRLQAFRESTNLSKKGFADKIGMDPGLYGRYEAGLNKPSIETLEKIVLTFPLLNAAWLIGGKGEMKTKTQPADPMPAPVEANSSELAVVHESAEIKELKRDRDMWRDMARTLADALKAGKGATAESFNLGNHIAAEQSIPSMVVSYRADLDKAA